MVEGYWMKCVKSKDYENKKDIQKLTLDLKRLILRDASMWEFVPQSNHSQGKNIWVKHPLWNTEEMWVFPIFVYKSSYSSVANTKGGFNNCWVRSEFFTISSIIERLENFLKRKNKHSPPSIDYLSVLYL